MRNKFFCITTFAVAVLLTSCKSKTGEAQGSESSNVETPSATVATESGTPAPANEPKTYQVKLTPDSALLGKQKEALLKVTKMEAVDLQDQEGKSQGIEIRIGMSLTNKNAIGGNTIGVSPSDFRLQLDNGNNITATSGSYWSAEPESTKEADPIIFSVPAGAKPKTLNLFYDNTRVGLPITLE